MELREKVSNETDGGVFVREVRITLSRRRISSLGLSRELVLRSRTRYFLGKVKMFNVSSNPSSRHSMALGAFFSKVRRISFRTVRASSIVSERKRRERAWARVPLWEAGA